MLDTCIDVSLEEKIAQMLVVGFTGDSFGEDLRGYVQDYKVGGIIFFNRDFGEKTSNITSPEQLKKLIGEIKSASTLLPFVSIDQEGGLVARLNEQNGFPETPTHRALSKLSVAEAQDEVRKLSTTLLDMGFNLNFAPVVDVLVNPDNPVMAPKERTFSDNPEQVITYASAYISAASAVGITSTLKHFPGHGSSVVDSHLGFTDITDTYQLFELLPFQQLIEEGYQGTVMVAHVFDRNVDEEFPASLSKAFITDILKQRLGFKGVVVSDDLGMRALVDHWSTEQILVNAINAGNDVLVYSNNLADFYDVDYVKNAIAIIKRNVLSGVIPESRIDEAYQAILTLKQTMPQ